MPIIDFSDLERKLDQTLEYQKRQDKILVFMLTHPNVRIVDIKMIAEWERVGISQLRVGGKERYLLPRFGQSAYPTGRARWPVEEYLEWSKRDPREREREYREHLRNQAAIKVEKMRRESRKQVTGK